MKGLFKEGGKKHWIYSLSAIAGVTILSLGGAYLTSNSEPANPTPTSKPERRTGSMGGVPEGSKEYNQTFQERLVSSMNTQVEEIRKENRLAIEAMQKSAEAREAALLGQIESLMNSKAAQQSVAQTAAVQVEKISVGSSLSGKSNASDGLFLGGPADVKPAGQENTGISIPGIDRKSTKPEANVPQLGFVDGTTLNGVVAKAGGAAEDILVTLTGPYRSANGYVANLHGCIAYLEAWADLPSSRITAKPGKLTCTFKDGSTQNWDVSGYVVDKEDGIKGIRGVVNDNGGKKLAGGALAGAVGVVGNAISREQQQTMASAGGVTTTFNGSVSRDVLGALVQGGATEVSKQISDYYGAYTASVQAGGARQITVVLLNELIVPENGKYITQTKTIPKAGG